MSGADHDPIFSAIGRHREALAALESTCPRADNVVAKQHGRIVTRADERAVNAADRREAKALRELLATTPVTVDGARAAMQYLIDFDGPDSSASGQFLPALMKSALLAA
jgi:hypothetical protein